MNIKKIAAAAILAVAGIGAVVLPFAVTGSASASTGGCTGGVYAGYCGTQTDAESSALSLDVYHQKALTGNKIIGYANSDNDRATDFYFFRYKGGASFIFEYAPAGVASGLCASEPFQGAGLELRSCNGSLWQQFTPHAITDPSIPSAPTTFTWSNGATLDIIASTGLRGQVAGVLRPSGSTVTTVPAADRWSFVG